jgi:hypothetical protein
MIATNMILYVFGILAARALAHVPFRLFPYQQQMYNYHQQLYSANPSQQAALLQQMINYQGSYAGYYSSGQTYVPYQNFITNMQPLYNQYYGNTAAQQCLQNQIYYLQNAQANVYSPSYWNQYPYQQQISHLQSLQRAPYYNSQYAPLLQSHVGILNGYANTIPQGQGVNYAHNLNIMNQIVALQTQAAYNPDPAYQQQVMILIRQLQGMMW